MREALFNVLDARLDVDGIVVLDLYAGSGALGLEAISRGASRAVFVEQDQRAARTISGNIAELGVGAAAEVRRAPVATVVAGGVDRPVDLVLADPPYDLPDSEVEELLAALDARGWTRDGTVAVVVQVADPDTPVGSVHLRIGEGAWIDLPVGNPRYSWDTTTVADGWYVLEAYATDRYSSGPVATHHLKVENMGPNNPPEVYIESPMEGDVAGDVLRARGIAFDQDDNVEEVRLRIDDGPWGAAEGERLPHRCVMRLFTT